MMENRAFARLMAEEQKKPPKEKLDKAEIRKLVSDDMQQQKKKKRKVEEKKTTKRMNHSTREDHHHPKKDPKYRDRARERRTTREDEAPEVDAEMSKYLGGDEEHTHLVKGLDYALLQKMRQEEGPVVAAAAATEKKKKKERHPMALGVARWLEGPTTTTTTRSNFRGTSLEYTLDDARPITRSRRVDDEFRCVGPGLPGDLLNRVAEALNRSKKKSSKKLPPPQTAAPQVVVESLDIFDGVGGLWTTTAPRPAPLHDDDDHDQQSRYFPSSRPSSHPITTMAAPPRQPPPPPPQPKVTHRDPIFGGAGRPAPRLARNFDGTDSAYGLAITYDSDDETYSMAKARAAGEKKKKRHRPPPNSSTTKDK